MKRIKIIKMHEAKKTRKVSVAKIYFAKYFIEIERKNTRFTVFKVVKSPTNTFADMAITKKLAPAAPEIPSRTRKKRAAGDQNKNSQKPPKSSKYSVPVGSTVDAAGNLIPPRAPSPALMSVTSSNSSLAGSTASLNASSAFQQTPKPQKQQQQKPISDTKPRKVKPIVVDSNYKVLDQLLNSLKLPSKPFMRISSGREGKAQTRIECATIDDKLAVITALKQKQFVFHSHPEPGNRIKLFVLKHHFRVELDEMMRIVEEAEIPASKVTFLLDHPERPVYLIHSNDEDININTLQHRHRTLGSLIVMWDRFDMRRKRPMPCRRCKMWGHAANSCGRPFRCIKCTATHAPGDCDRKDRSIGTPKCVNCDGDHPANSTTCPSYAAYAKGIQRRRQIQNRNVSRSTTVRWPSAGAAVAETNFIHSNPQNNASSYSATVRGTQNASGSAEFPSLPSQSQQFNFADLHAQFASIPNIGQTMNVFGEMIAKLQNTEVESERLLILMQYCCPQNAA